MMVQYAGRQDIKIVRNKKKRRHRKGTIEKQYKMHEVNKASQGS